MTNYNAIAGSPTAAASLASTDIIVIGNPDSPSDNKATTLGNLQQAISNFATANRIVNVTTATLTVTAALHDGKTLTLNRAGGIAITLPTPVAGMRFKFVVQTTFTGAASIKSVSGAHIMIGHAILGNDSDNNTVMWQALAANTFDTIDMFGTANSTGGIAGQTITIEALNSTTWLVEIQGDAAGTEATPFQDTVA